MSPQTVKLLMMFFLATALLNVTNYLFYLLYDPPSRQAMKAGSWQSKVIKKLPTKHRHVHTVRWTAFLLAKEKPAAVSSTTNDTKTVDADSADYRDQSETSHFYEYNRGVHGCPLKPPGLGPVNLDEALSLESIERLYDMVTTGGIYEESECAARQNVAIFIPHSGRKNELLKFLYTLHPFLIKQQLDYQIFVVEQDNMSIPLNRGKMLNAAFSEVQRIQGLKKEGGWKCVIFHELDLVPVDSRNLYRCSKNPHQLVAVVNNRTYEYQFGGALSMHPSQFTKVNGFSNLYSGNEAVYDDLYKRLLVANYTITRSTTFGKYLHSKKNDDLNQTRFQTIQTTSPLYLIDGLSTLNYKLDYIDAKQLYTLIGVDIDSPSSSNGTEKIWSRLLSQATVTTPMKQSSGKFI